MPRPRKCRAVGFVPKNSCFYPDIQNQAEVVLSIEEVEALSDCLIIWEWNRTLQQTV